MSAATGAVGRPAAGSPDAGAARRARRAAGPASTCPAVVVAVAGLVLWEAIVRSLQLRAFILPAPSAILSALIDNWNGDRFPLWKSAQSHALRGRRRVHHRRRPPASSSRSLAAAGRGCARVLLPLAVAASAIPIIAFAPLFNTWFGCSTRCPR